MRAIIFARTDYITEKPIILYELMMKCRDSKHQFFGRSDAELRKLSLIGVSDDSIHDSIRNIVLSATSGEGTDMTLGSPIKQ